MQVIRPFLRLPALIVRIILFLLTILLIAYLFPKEGKFKYEYQKGAPWLHETLIATEAFPIYKTREELKNEQDSLQTNQLYYFREKPAQTEQLEAEFLQYLATRLDKIWDDTGDSLSIDSAIARKGRLRAAGAEVFRNLYQHGVLPEVVPVLENKPGEYLIHVVRNDIAEQVRLSDLHKIATLENHCRKMIGNHPIWTSFPEYYERDFLARFQPKPYLKANLQYDALLTETKLQMTLDNISLTEGMVRKNQRIIDRGDIVNPELFKMLESYKLHYEESIGRNTSYTLLLLGQFLVVFSIMLMFFLFLFNYRREVLNDLKQTIFILLMIVLFVSVASGVIRFKNINLYFIPFALLPIIVRTFYDSRLAIFILLITSLLIGFMAPNGFEFVFIQFLAGVVAIFSMHNAKKRSQLFWSAFFVFLTYSFLNIALRLMQEGSLENVHWPFFIWLLGNAVLLLSSYPLIYLFEKLFGFLSDLSLLELSDTNNVLLRDLASKAPGTFQHSMQVANLAEEAIYKIGGNTLLMRTGALYHDIGKMENPAFFIENLQSGFNPHQNIPFEESADIIIGHVTHGIQLAKKHKLPQAIIDFIQTHHGTTKVQYFYKSFLKKYPNEEADVNRFTYPGPLPFSKETAVLMMADSVEAASRSMKVYSEQSISDLVDQIINYQEQEGQFDEATITFKEVNQVKEVFKAKLRNIYHQRIEYPQ